MEQYVRMCNKYVIVEEGLSDIHLYRTHMWQHSIHVFVAQIVVSHRKEEKLCKRPRKNSLLKKKEGRKYIDHVLSNECSQTIA